MLWASSVERVRAVITIVSRGTCTAASKKRTHDYKRIYIVGFTGSRAGISRYYSLDASEVDRRLELGLLKLSEASGVRAEATRAAATEAEERLLVAQERAALAALLGRDAGCIESARDERFLAARQPPALVEALDEAARRSPALIAGEAELAAATLDRRREARAALPDIGVSGVSALAFGREGRGIDRTSRIGLDLNAPL